METKKENIIHDVYTYTYTDEATNPMEVLLVGVINEKLGLGNGLNPNGFKREHITTWLRQRYFFTGDVVYAQIPRKIRNFPDAARKQFNADSSFASDVAIKESEIQIYYPKNETESVCLIWDTSVDQWSMTEVTQPSDKENVDIERGHAASARTIWKSP